MKAVWNGVTIAQSADTVVVEGNHYFPLASIDAGVLKPSTATSRCGWKGLANYYTVSAGGKDNADAAWYYADPLEKAANIKGRVAFWKGVTVSA